jgi:predicted AAA+ superfamily ATPase
MRGLLETLQREGLDTIALSANNVPRDFQFPSADNIIKVAIGIRRSGKTYFLYQTIHSLMMQGVESTQILLINFEDDRLLPMTAKQMGTLLDTFYTMYPQNYNRLCYLFLDEVQNIPDWHQVVRRYFDSKNVRLYLTGSSAKLLSTEIATSLRGRSLAIEVWPYDFNEYLVAHKIEKPPAPLGKKGQDIMQAHLLRYFETGGFPAVQNLPQNEWREMLQGYVDTVILRDIVERHGVTNIPLLKYLTNTLMKNAARTFSVNKFYNDIQSQGYKISKDTIHLYLSYIEDAFLAFTVPIYSESERAKSNIPKKIYIVDNGLVNATTLDTSSIYSKLFENQIYLDLRRQGKKIYYYTTQNGYEIDFVTIDITGKKELIQVCWNMDDAKTAEREERALMQAENELGFGGRIITLTGYLRSALS